MSICSRKQEGRSHQIASLSYSQLAPDEKPSLQGEEAVTITYALKGLIPPFEAGKVEVSTP